MACPRSSFGLMLTAGMFGTAVFLQGCGGGGGGPSPSPGPTPTTITTTMHPFSDAMTSAEAAEFMNKQYMGFDEKDDSSPLGLTISMASAIDSFYKNIYCSAFPNPVLGTTGCSLGRTDCRMSASLYNHKMMVKNDTGATNLGLGRAIGYVFNQTLVETYYGKCSYVWDGASDAKFNIGCGDSAATRNCSDPHSAFGNVCPSTGKICTENDIEVKRGFCTQFGGLHPIPPTHGGNSQCAIPGPAINYHLQDDWKPAPDNLRVMAKARVQYNGGKDDEGPNIEKWNEIVIDEHLLIPKIKYDPALAIPAIIYVLGPNNHDHGKKMRDEYCKYNNLVGKKCIPLVGVDTSKGKTEGPFVAEASDSAVVV